MQRALRHPEIVEAIIRNRPPRHQGFLFSCLRVNKLFFDEAARCLWYQCGSVPSIDNLVRLETDRKRLYARYIRVLEFGWSYGKDSDMTGPDNLIHEIYRLTDLSWPGLRELSIISVCTGANIECLLPANLVRFTVLDGENMSDGVLEWLTTGSSRLRYFEMRIFIDNKITPQALQRFLSHSNKLQELKCLEMDWNLKCFEIVAQYSQLTTLRCPPILPNWPKNIEPGFSALNSLTCAISAEALERLYHHTPRLTFLQINIEVPSHGLVQAASNFECLETLSLITTRRDVEWEINGAELISLSRNCKHLQKLVMDDIRCTGYMSFDREFSSEGYYQKDHIFDEDTGSYIDYLEPTGVDMWDSTIAAAALYFRNLEELDLKFQNAAGISFASIQSLGEHCSKLKKLRINCKVDWEQFQRTNFETSAPALRALYIQTAPEVLPSPDFSDDVRDSFVEKLAKFLPNLSSFWFSSISPFERRLGEVVTKALSEGTWNRLVSSFAKLDLGDNQANSGT